MTRSDLIGRLAADNPQFSAAMVESAVKNILESIVGSLEQKDRVEIRGFGSFSLHYRKPRIGRNPKTGKSVQLKGKHVPHFKAGKEFRERVLAGGKKGKK